MTISSSIFKAYDIRGIVGKTIHRDTAFHIGYALGCEVLERGGEAIAVGRDGRLSGPMLVAALSEGLQASGVDVVDIGQVPTPIGYFTCYHAINGRVVDSCVVVTGSHNPPDYNGFKMVVRGRALFGDQIAALYKRVLTQINWTPEQRIENAGKQGSYQSYDMGPAYLERIVRDIRLERPLKLVVDCGNGVAGAFAPALFRALGCEVRTLFCEVDGHFPNHHPDPAQPENLQDVIHALATTDAELGLAFDGDGDRLGVVTKSGAIIYPDRQLMLFAQDVLKRHPGGTILYDVKCTRLLAPWIREHGGQPLMWKTGHSLIKSKMQECGAALAGEMSGHIFFKDRWFGFDDGLYTAARLCELLSRVADPGAVLEALPNAHSTPELHLPLPDGENSKLIEQLQRTAVFPQAQACILMDGLRVEYSDGFGLARASNTTPVVVFRFEADTTAALTRIQKDFKRVLEEQGHTTLPF